MYPSCFLFLFLTNIKRAARVMEVSLGTFHKALHSLQNTRDLGESRRPSEPTPVAPPPRDWSCGRISTDVRTCRSVVYHQQLIVPSAGHSRTRRAEVHENSHLKRNYTIHDVTYSMGTGGVDSTQLAAVAPAFRNRTYALESGKRT